MNSIRGMGALILSASPTHDLGHGTSCLCLSFLFCTMRQLARPSPGVLLEGQVLTAVPSPGQQSGALTLSPSSASPVEGALLQKRRMDGH